MSPRSLTPPANTTPASLDRSKHATQPFSAVTRRRPWSVRLRRHRPANKRHETCSRCRKPGWNGRSWSSSGRSRCNSKPAWPTPPRRRRESACPMASASSRITQRWVSWQAKQPRQKPMALRARLTVSTLCPASAAPRANSSASASELPPVRGLVLTIRMLLIDKCLLVSLMLRHCLPPATTDAAHLRASSAPELSKRPSPQVMPWPYSRFSSPTLLAMVLPPEVANGTTRLPSKS